MTKPTRGQLQEIRRIILSKGADSERVQQILTLGFLADLFDPRASLVSNQRPWPGYSNSVREDVRMQLGLASIMSMYGRFECNYRTPLDTLIAECDFDGTPDERITETNFPRQAGKQKRMLTWKLLTFNHHLSPEDAKAEIDERKLGFRHATLQELLEFRRHWKKNGRSMSGYFENEILALGEGPVIENYQGRTYPVTLYPRLRNMGFMHNGESNWFNLDVCPSDGRYDPIRQNGQVLLVADFKSSHFPRARVKAFVRKGSIVEGRKVTAIGKSYEFGILNKLTPCRFEDGKCGIVSLSESKGIASPMWVWHPDTAAAKNAIENATNIPRVQGGIGSDVIHVFGVDADGPFRVKLFYNEKSDRPDELYRL